MLLVYSSVRSALELVLFKSSTAVPITTSDNAVCYAMPCHAMLCYAIVITR